MAKSKRATVTMYMHTIDGKPASYYPGEQIAFADQGQYSRSGVVLVPSIKQIHAEQDATRKWRDAQGYSTEGWNYSYVRVEVPSSVR